MAFCAATREDVTVEPSFLLERWQTFIAKAPGGLARLGEVDRSRREARLPPQHLLPLLHERKSATARVCGSCCLTPRDDRLTAYEGGRPILTV